MDPFKRAIILTGLLLGMSLVQAQEPSKAEQITQTSPAFFDPFAVKGACDMAVTLEPLFWIPHQDGLSDVIKNDNGTTSITHGHVKRPDSKWSVGGRVGLDFKLPHDKWDILLSYTYFQGRANHHLSAPSSGALFPQWTFPATTGLFATHMSSEWKLHLHLADIELGRNCFPSNWLSLRPFMGVRGAVINQLDKITYEGGTVAPIGSDRVRMTNDYWGVGVRFGVDSLWGLCRGFSIYGDVAASLLSGHFHVRQREMVTNPPTTTFKIRDNESIVSAIVELALGLQWDTYLDQDKYHLGIKMGWEFNHFFDQNKWMQFTTVGAPGKFTQSEGDLSLQGLTVGFRFDF